MRREICRSFAIFLACIFVQDAEAALSRVDGKTMGTTYRVVYQDGTGPSISGKKLKSILDKLLVDLNAEMSHYIPQSDISKFNRTKVGQKTLIKKDFHDVLQYSLLLARETGGVFDPTIAPLLAFHGFGPRGRDKKNDNLTKSQQLAKIKKKVGYQKVLLRRKSNRFALSKKAEGLELDLSATAKGFGVDKLFEKMSELGFKSFLVEIGGELRATQLKSDGSGASAFWQVGVESPLAKQRQVKLKVPLSSLAIATSGNYRNFKVGQDGQQIGHIFNPTLLKPLQTRVASISVLAETCMEADGLATALLAMGEKEGKAFAKKKGLKAIFIVLEEGQFRVRKTSAYVEYEKRLKKRRL